MIDFALRSIIAQFRKKKTLKESTLLWTCLYCRRMNIQIGLHFTYCIYCERTPHDDEIKFIRRMLQEWKVEGEWPVTLLHTMGRNQ